jgi:hypothetical protein
MATGRLGSPTSITGIVRQQTRSVISAQNFTPKPNVALVELTDVTATGAQSPQNGQAIIFNSSTGKFEANTIIANITAVDGGRF